MEFAVDAGTFAPSVGEVRTLLAQDRVRQALDRAEALNAQYRGSEAALVYGWAAWRNGDFRVAEVQFRRAAEAGLAEANAGLAALRASSAEWQQAIELARSATAGEAPGKAHAMLASAAWVAGDAQTAALEMQAWSVAEPGTARGRAAQAMAEAARRLRGPAAEWGGTASELDIVAVEDGWAVEATINGTPALLKLDLTFRQSVVAPRLASAAGLVVDGTPGPSARAATSRWPALLSPRQAAVEEVAFGNLSLRNAVVAVSDVPAGVDGVLAADILTALRWSLMFRRAKLVVAPPSSGARRLEGIEEGSAAAWLRARVCYEGLGVQLLLFPRVDQSVVAAGVDLGTVSRLDSDDLVVRPGENNALTELMMGGWRDDVTWRPASLSGWALDGGIAPTAVLGDNVLGAWALHWYPATRQLRVDGPPDPAGRAVRR